LAAAWCDMYACCCCDRGLVWYNIAVLDCDGSMVLIICTDGVLVFVVDWCGVVDGVTGGWDVWGLLACWGVCVVCDSCGWVIFTPGLPNGVAGYKNLNCVGDSDLLLLGGVIWPLIPPPLPGLPGYPHLPLLVNTILWWLGSPFVLWSKGQSRM